MKQNIKQTISKTFKWIVPQTAFLKNVCVKEDYNKYIKSGRGVVCQFG